MELVSGLLTRAALARRCDEDDRAGRFRGLSENGADGPKAGDIEIAGVCCIRSDLAGFGQQGDEMVADDAARLG